MDFAIAFLGARLALELSLGVIILMQMFAIGLLLYLLKTREPLESLGGGFSIFKGWAFEYKLNRDEKIKQLTEENNQLREKFGLAKKETEDIKSSFSNYKLQTIFMILGFAFIFVFIAIGQKTRNLSKKKDINKDPKKDTPLRTDDSDFLERTNFKEHLKEVFTGISDNEAEKIIVDLKQTEKNTGDKL